MATTKTATRKAKRKGPAQPKPWPSHDMLLAASIWREEAQRRGVDPVTLAQRIGLLSTDDLMSFFASTLRGLADSLERKKEAVAAVGQ